MKRINLTDYNPSLGTLIDVSEPAIYKERALLGSINIPYQKLLLNYRDLLNKNQKYYIMCTKGIHSQKVVSILEFNGYDVTQVIRNG